jgi:creatinine amidohydrolase
MAGFQNNQRIADISAAVFAAQSGQKPVILLPLGSLEDHGFALPMGDFVLADVLAGRIAEGAAAAGVPVYAAPALPFGAADFFGSSPGGMAIAPATFRAVLSDLLAGFLRHGLNRIVILNGHGGNVPAIHEVTLALQREAGLVVPSFYLWKVARALMERELGPDGNGRFGHGAEPLLSLTRALRPEFLAGAVLPGAAAPGAAAGRLLGLPVTGFGTVIFEEVEVEVPGEFGDAPHDAIRTAAPLADAALGARIADRLVEVAVRFVVHVARHR